jgi:DMSO/TMAO reductase YedYZ heme-binding membrane subunit
MENIKKANNHALIIISWTFVFSLGYAILRYHIAGPVPWKDLPFFILNKGISLCAFILLSFNFTYGPLKNLGVNVSNSMLSSRRIVGIVGFILTFIHVIISFMLFKPAIYAKFFEPDQSLTLNSGLSMLGGALAFVFIWLYNVSFNSEIRKDKDLIRFINNRTVLLIAFFLSGAHLFFMGYEGWMEPSSWYGGLPPISLIAFTFFTVGFVINLFGRKNPQ